MPLDPPTDNRFALHSPDPESIRHWANRIPGVGKWVLFSQIGYTSPWADFSATDRAPRIRREFADIVRIEGVLKTTANVSSGAVIITLPPDFRPQRSQDLPSNFASNSIVVQDGIQFRINPAGQLILNVTSFGAGVTYPFMFISGTYTISADK